jgi:hypothetical protein
MNKEEFLKLSDLDKVKYSIEESLKEHKGYEREYFKGSAAMGKSILQTIEQVKEFAITDVSQQRELLLAYEQSKCPETWWMSKNQAENEVNDFIANNCG